MGAFSFGIEVLLNRFLPYCIVCNVLVDTKHVVWLPGSGGLRTDGRVVSPSVLAKMLFSKRWGLRLVLRPTYRGQDVPCVPFEKR